MSAPDGPLGEAGARLRALVAAEAHMIVRTLRPTDEGSWAVNELFIQKVLERFADALLSAPVVSPPPSHGVELIAAERQRQTTIEGWTAFHDDYHDDSQLSNAARCYIQQSWRTTPMKRPPADWPWEAEWWKPADNPIRNLVKAGALIAAEIDRLQRLEAEEAAAVVTQEGEEPCR